MKKKCFICKIYKDLNEYKFNARLNSLKSDLGRCFVCFDCSETKTIQTMSCLKFNHEKNCFETVNFNSVNEVKDYYKKMRENDVKAD